MYKKTFGIIAVTLLLIICGSLWFLSVSTNPIFAATFDISVPNNLISIQPNGPLFKMENMAPGDVQSALLTIANIVEMPCHITLTAEQQNGDSMLADLLEITVSSLDQSITYYTGPLSGLKQINLGSIGSLQSKEISLKITFPYKTSNEAQGKSISVDLVIVAIIQDPSIPQGSGNGSSTVFVVDDGIPEAPAIITTPGMETASQPSTDDGKAHELLPTESPVVLDEEKLPQGSLPGTGGMPFEVFTVLGASFAFIGIRLKIRRKTSPL